jgi:methionyl-tRNA formyltransferase
MRVAIIGRSELMYNTALLIAKLGYEIPLVITAKESPEYIITSKHFEDFAKQNNAIFISTGKINTPEVKEVLKSMGKIDIAISINYSGIISQEIIDYFEIGILNAHGGDLPMYRGNACQAWAIINGEDSIGLCIHKMVGGELDSGDIINREYLPIDINTKIGKVYEWMNTAIPDLIVNSIKKLKEDSTYFLEKQSKNPKDALRCYPRTPEDGEIDWTKTNTEILRLINASGEPFGGAYCRYNGNKLIIWRAEMYEDEEIYLSTSGQVASISKDGHIIVITGSGKLKITEIEYEGNRTSQINEVIKTIRIKLK